MRFRTLNRIRAFLGGYFWLPCPLCDEMFGGHEWQTGNDLYTSPVIGVGVCPDCGEEARKRSNKFKQEE